GELRYESPDLILDGNAQDVVFFPELIQFKNWKLTSSKISKKSDQASSRIQCVIEYTGDVSLSAAQLHASKPVVLLMPASGASYIPTAPKPPWGVEAPTRRENNDGPMNLVIVMIDTLRDDCTPPYGHPFVIAPHLDMLAAMGTMFTNAYSASSSTRPSIGTIFSGLHPVVHGADRHALNGARLRHGFPVIAEYFSNEGFETAGAVSNAQVTAAYGFERGFDRYHCPIRDHEVTTVGIKELQRLNEPFFLYLHYIAPHQPYKPAGLYKGLYSGRTAYPEMDAYLEEITQDDRRAGRILAELARQGLLDRTVIWALSDHGEEFWEHGWNGHGAKLYEETVRTVSIVTNPATLPIGRKIDIPVMHADVFPTLIDLWGGTVDFPTVGFSLTPFLQEETSSIPDEFTRRSVFLHHGGGTKAEAHPSDKEAILFENEKWIWWTQTNVWEHYNLVDDPGETNNLVKSASGTISNMQDALLRFWQAQHHLAERLSTPGGDGQVNLSRQEMENLRDLGYVK
ncbi:sulfatase, partial [bacterium]|nr:sulfatase [bacterium]